MFFKNLAYITGCLSSISAVMLSSLLQLESGTNLAVEANGWEAAQPGLFPGLAKSEEHRRMMNFLWGVSQKSRECASWPGGAI